jgi:hypothetical protein
MNLSRDPDSNILRMTALGNKAPILVDISAVDFPVTVPIKAISSCGGSKVMATVNGVSHVPIPAPGCVRVINVTLIEKTGTDATDIVAWPDDESI